MRTLLFLAVFVCLVGVSYGYCYASIVQEDRCTAPNGVTIPVNETLLIPEKCEKCSCSASNPQQTSVMLSCCGYGSHAGVFLPPPGCKQVAGDDVCSVKMVQITDESQPCPHT